jgi:molybdopterin-guanine dinucleotide biosynthesis protein A
MPVRTRPDVTIAVLAGGLATRLPGKLSLRIGDESMLERVIRRLARSRYPMVLSVRAALPMIAAERQIADAFADKGPLGGLASVAAHISTPLLFAAAADLPNIDERAVEACVRRYEASVADGADPEAVVPRHADGRIEPLAALYATRALHAAADEALAHDRLRVSAVLDRLRTVYFDVTPVEESSYHNVNTAADFERIRSS